ncbi:MAG TPA: methyltransferase, partial [Nitrospira sp.]|nr:methyltransferase [Nitrospira sp.]
MNELPQVTWIEAGLVCSARWRSEWNASPPVKVSIADDRMTADAAFRQACEGTALLWRGDFQNGRQLLNAMARRVDRHPPKTGASPADSFHLHRQAQSRRARILGMLLVALDETYGIHLRRAPDVRQACIEAYGPLEGTALVSLRELLGVVGASEWRKKGLVIPALG